MPKEHQTPADIEAARPTDAATSASQQSESTPLPARPTPLPDPFQFTVYLQQLAAGAGNDE